MTLDQLPLSRQAEIVAVDWSALASQEGKRLRALGVDEGAQVSVAYRGMFGSSDPLAILIGRMTLALRRSHAAAVTVREL